MGRSRVSHHRPCMLTPRHCRLFATCSIALPAHSWHITLQAPMHTWGPLAAPAPLPLALPLPPLLLAPVPVPVSAPALAPQLAARRLSGRAALPAAADGHRRTMHSLDKSRTVPAAQARGSHQQQQKHCSLPPQPATHRSLDACGTAAAVPPSACWRGAACCLGSDAGVRGTGAAALPAVPSRRRHCWHRAL